ncbi:MAG: hypothetical protein P8L85_18920 [Rubripirellula sp.]|nr:hypothetical protein [Rubripirellula sp.]
MLGSFRPFACLLFAGLLLAQPGCVALNIPSQRWHDPNDEGGVFGHLQGTTVHRATGQELLLGTDSTVLEVSEGPYDHTLVSPGFHGGPGFHDPDGSCVDCEPNCFDPLAETEATAPPEIPWPKFHPVPTRPVFGPHGVH